MVDELRYCGYKYGKESLVTTLRNFESSQYNIQIS